MFYGITELICILFRANCDICIFVHVIMSESIFKLHVCMNLKLHESLPHMLTSFYSDIVLDVSVHFHLLFSDVTHLCARLLVMSYIYVLVY